MNISLNGTIGSSQQNNGYDSLKDRVDKHKIIYKI